MPLDSVPQQNVVFYGISWAVQDQSPVAGSQLTRHFSKSFVTHEYWILKKVVPTIPDEAELIKEIEVNWSKALRLNKLFEILLLYCISLT